MVMTCKILFAAGKEEMRIIASALNRLPARTIWKLSQQEVAAAGGLEALNLTERVKVCTAECSEASCINFKTWQICGVSNRAVLVNMLGSIGGSLTWVSRFLNI